jgi:hypothetical protein
MNRLTLVAAAVMLVTGTSALAQEHYTEGPVWGCAAYRTKQGKFDDYMKYLRTHYLPTSAEAKKQGLVLDTRIFVQTPARPDDWDVSICTLHTSYGKALDYDAEADKKADAIQAAHWKTANSDEQAKLSAQRFEMRDFIGVGYSREVSLKPMN